MSKLLKIVDDLDKIDALNFINLNTMTTLDFSILLDDRKENWSESKPIYYDENQGLVIIKIAEQGLRYILNNSLTLTHEQEEDINILKKFIGKNGLLNNYEVATF